MFYQTEGIVLRETAYKDSDKLLTVLTKDHGKVTLKARGVRKNTSPLKSACQLLAYSEFTYQEMRGQLIVKEAVCREMFPELRSDIEAVSLGFYFAQTAEVLSEEDYYDPALLSLLLILSTLSLGITAFVVKAMPVTPSRLTPLLLLTYSCSLTTSWVL